jgi:adenylate kinase
MSLNLVMLGPPGAGKGTQAVRLARTWTIPHISTGAILREAVKAATPLGVEVKGIMETGGLIDDSIITRIVCDRLGQPDVSPGFLLDGYPRTVTQAVALDAFMAGRPPLVVVEMVLSEADVLQRLAARMICAECGTNAQDDRDYASCHDCGGPLVPRIDDREAVVRNRLEIYHRQTSPLVAYYSGRPTFCRVDGAQMVDDVTADIVAAVTSASARS